MITDEQQYRVTKARIQRFEDALMHAEDRAAERHPLLQQVLRRNVEAELQAMYEQLSEYATRQGTGPSTLGLGAGLDRPLALIRTRIAAGINQEELAERLGLAEQQIRQYEAARYARAE